MSNKITHLQPSDLRAMARLATDATKGVTDLVEAMHATIVRPMGLASRTAKDRTTGLTGLVYKAVRGTTGLVQNSLDLALRQLKPRLTDRSSSFERDAVISALNGVLGDYLVATENELAIPMSFYRDGDPLTINEESLARIPNVSGRILIVIHGLCMNDRQWLHNGHNHAESLAAELGYTPIYLRYNSGQHVSVNGRELSERIDTLIAAWPQPVEDITILAHSMGGLVARSASHFASERKHAWIKTLKKIVFLGTPHHGAPLERGGHWIDIILGATPYAKPFARLGKVRSVGITDLRYGYVTESDWTHPKRAQTTPLPAKVKCYAIAATTGKTEHDWKDRLLGDGLVPVASALGMHDEAEHTLKFAKTRQWVGYEMNHMQLLSDSRVYAKLLNWLR
ncbi:MAG: alpha/beta hydrolase [Betaproteobacteria bacterium]|nr:MAG: alpha/beta hydrolase [Betaproteobacteria bacterium]